MKNLIKVFFAPILVAIFINSVNAADVLACASGRFKNAGEYHVLVRFVSADNFIVEGMRHKIPECIYGHYYPVRFAKADVKREVFLGTGSREGDKRKVDELISKNWVIEDTGEYTNGRRLLSRNDGWMYLNTKEVFDKIKDLSKENGYNPAADGRSEITSEYIDSSLEYDGVSTKCGHYTKLRGYGHDEKVVDASPEDADYQVYTVYYRRWSHPAFGDIFYIPGAEDMDKAMKEEDF